jgi:hypothetical protein
LQSRLARARRRLRERLTRPGLPAVYSANTAASTRTWMADFAGRFLPPPGLAELVCRQSLVLRFEPALVRTTVSSSVQVLVNKGLNSLFVSRLSNLALVSLTGIFLFGAILFGGQTSARPGQDEKPATKHVGTETQRATGDSPSARSRPPVVPAPRETRATAGRGQALVYALHKNGNRIRMEPVPNKNRRRRRLGPADHDGFDKEVIVDLSWAAVTGVVDHRAIESGFGNGAKIGRLAAEHVYRRVELERQERSDAGVWSNWRGVDPEPTLRFLDNLPELDFEKTPDDLRIFPLIDPLPYLKAGVWAGVDVDRFVPALIEKNAAPKIGGWRPATAGPSPLIPPLLMMRQLDFTVQPGQIYKYRARLVVDDSRSRKKEVAGAWSEPTEPVTVPQEAK